MSLTVQFYYTKPQFVRVLRDYEAHDGLIRVGYPAILSMALNKFSPMTQGWQEFWFAQIVHSYKDYQHGDKSRLTKTEREILNGKWYSLTKGKEAFTNHKGTDLYRDYIRNENIGKSLPGQEPLAICGNIYRPAGEPFDLYGERVQAVYALDGTHNPPDFNKVNFLTHPELISCAVNVPADKPQRDPATWTLHYLPDGTWEHDPFPQLDPRHTPVPFVTNGSEADEIKLRFRDRGWNHPAGRFTEDGIDYAYNYIRWNRLTTAHGFENPYNP